MAKMSSIRILFEAKEVDALLLGDLYRVISNACSFPFDDKNFEVNCTKINIAQNIQDNMYKAYRRDNLETYSENPEAFDTQVTMVLCMSGPKVDKKLPENTVEVFDGAFDVSTICSETLFYPMEIGLALSRAEMEKVVARFSAINSE